MSDQPTAPATTSGANLVARRRWLLAGLIAVVAATGIGLAVSQRSSVPSTAAQPAETSKVGPPEGKLQLFVRPRAGAPQPLSIDEAGALPIRAGGSMNMEVHLDKAAFIYLVWINSEGKLLPLYPWNTDTLEIKDVSEPFPQRRASKVVFSPLVLGGGWLFGSVGGTETVLLLARRSPLPDEVQLGDVLKELSAPPQLEESSNLATAHASASGNQEPKQSPLGAFITPLSKHFELIDAVQFAHVGE